MMNVVINILCFCVCMCGFSEEVNVGCFARVVGVFGVVIVVFDFDFSEA